MATFTSVEFLNIELLDKIIANWKELPLTDDQRKPTRVGDKEYPLLSILKKLRKSAGKPVVYSYSKTDIIEGRQFAVGGGLQGLKRFLRHTIATGYHDYDIVNCHPEIFVQYCRKKGYDTTSFDSYISDREKYLNELMTINNISRDPAKAVVLSILNGGAKDYLNLAVKPMWLEVFKNSIGLIQKQIMADPDNAVLVQGVRAYKKKNVAGSVLNHILCHIENKVLMESISFLKVIEPVLCFDGFMTKHEVNLSGLKEHILESTGYSLNWIEKPMTEGLDLSAFSAEVDHEDDETPAMKLDELIKAKGDYIKNINKSIWVFDQSNGMWVRNHFGGFMKLCREHFGVSSQYGGVPRFMRELFILCEALPDESNFYAKGVKKRLGKVLYSNGIKNIETDSFGEFDHTIFFTKAIPREYKVQRDEKMIHKVRSTLFEAPFEGSIATLSGKQITNGISKEFLKVMSVAMTGLNNREAVYDNIGTGSNGKTLMMDALLEAYPGYIEPFMITSIRVNPHAKANEHNDTLVMMADTRIGFASEGGAGMVVDSEALKRITSQEAMYARECGEKKVKVKPEMTLLAFAQNPMVFDKNDSAIQRRHYGFRWDRTFKKVWDGSLDFLETDACYEALDHILQDGYNLWKEEGFLEIEELCLFREELHEEQDVFGDLLAQTFTVESDKENKDYWVKTTEVYNAFKSLKMSQYTIKEKFKKLGVECKIVRKDGIQGTHFKGLTKLKPASIFTTDI
jgi:hypothetical protein